ncbi:MAG: general stress protein [Nakamurella sp.]
MTAPGSFGTQARAMAMPTPPTGFAVAAYPNYAQAQAAVEFLAVREFAVQDVTIVGSDLQLVERVTGRLTRSKVAAAGAASGAWFGLFVGLLMGLFSTTVQGGSLLIIVVAVAIGALFGVAMGLLGYSVTKGRRDYTSSSQVVAQRYDLLCNPATAEQARNLLAKMELGQRG